MPQEQAGAKPISAEGEKVETILRYMKELETTVSDKNNQIIVLKEMINNMHNFATEKSPTSGGV